MHVLVAVHLPGENTYLIGDLQYSLLIPATGSHSVLEEEEEEEEVGWVVWEVDLVVENELALLELLST